MKDRKKMMGGGMYDSKRKKMMGGGMYDRKKNDGRWYDRKKMMDGGIVKFNSVQDMEKM